MVKNKKEKKGVHKMKRESIVKFKITAGDAKHEAIVLEDKGCFVMGFSWERWKLTIMVKMPS